MYLILACALATTWVVVSSDENGANPWLDRVIPENERIITDEVFEPLHTYTFLYDAQVATGIPGASKQHSGTRIQCLAELIFNSQTSCTLQLSHIRFGRMNREIPNPRQTIPFDAFEEVPLHDDVKLHLATPVGFTYKDGIVGDVTFNGEENPWSTNVIRGVLNMMHVTLNPEYQLPTEARHLVNVINPNDPLLKSHSIQYRVQETTLEGDCETIYTVFNVSSTDQIDRLILLKTIDFDKCTMRPEIKYNFRFADTCPYCRSPDQKSKIEFLKTSTLAKYQVRASRSGNWMLENVKYEGEHIFTPYDPQAGVAVSYLNQTLTLLKSTNSTSTARQFDHPVKSEWGLMYALDWDIWKERFEMDGEEDTQLHFLRRMSYSDVKQEKRALIPGLFRALLSEMRSPEGQLSEEAPRHMMRLVYAFRLFTKTELDDVYRELTSSDEGPWTSEQRKIIKDMLPLVTAMCSTRDCVVHLIEKIKNGDVPPTKAAAALKCLMTDLSISAREIEGLLTLADTELASQNFLLRQSLWLTIGSLMNGLCMPNEDVLAREYREDVNTFCTRQLKENYVEILFSKLGSAEKWMDRVLFMKAIGNAGIDLSIFKLEQIIRKVDGQIYSSRIRTEAILAMRQLKNIMPRKLQKILLPIVANQMETPSVRITAAYQLLQTMPDRAILDQIARMLFTEPSKQVASFIYTYMHTLAKSTNPCEQRLVGDLKLALRNAQVDDIGKAGQSSMRYYDIYNRLYHSGVEMEVSSVFSNMSFLPKHFATTFHVNTMGFWYKYLFTLGLAQDGLEPIVRDWMLGGKNGLRSEQPQRPASGAGAKDRFRRLVQSAATGVERELNALFTKLGVKARTNPDTTREPKVYATVKFLDQDTAMIPFILTEEQRTMKLADGIIDLKKIREDLRSGISIDVNEADLLAEMTYKIPTILGMPLVWNIRIPLMYSIVGRVQVASTPENGAWKNMTIIVDLKPSLVATAITQMEIWSPVVNSGLRILSKAKLHMPIDARFEIDRSADPAVTKFSFKLPSGKKELFSLETRPTAITRVWPPRPLKSWNEPGSVSIISEDKTRISQFKRCFGKTFFGVEICARGQYARPSDLIQHAPRCPLIGPEKILISLKLTTKFYEKSNESVQPSFENWVEFPEHGTESSESEPSEPEQRQSTFDRKYQVRKPWKHTVHLEMDGKGQRLLNADFVHHYDQNHLYGKEKWIIQSPLAPDLPVCFKSETLFPTPPYTVHDMLKIDTKKVVSMTKIAWGNQQCEGPNYIALQMQAHQPTSHYQVHRRDPDHIIFERCSEYQHPSNCSAIMQYRHLFKSSDLTKYRLMIEHKNVPRSIANVTLKLYEWLKHSLFSHSDINGIGVGNPNSKIFLDLELNARDKSRGDLTIRGPHENVCFVDVPMPRLLPVFNLKYHRMTAFLDYVTGNGNRALCHISRRKIKTFDGVEFSTPLSTCFHIVAKDCSYSPPRFVIMMRRISEDLKMELKIITTTQKVIMTAKDDNSVEIDVNGKKYPDRITETEELTDDEDRVSIRIEAMGPYVKVEFPKLKLYIYFDGYAVNIELSPLYMHDQCGLCGHFNKETVDDFRKPNFEAEDDVRQFFASWTLDEPAGCTLPEPKSVCTEERCPYRPFSETDENSDPEKVELQEKPHRKTRVIEINGQICFSASPVDQCRLRTYPIQKETHQVRFACYDRNDEEAESMLARLRLDDVIPVNREATGVRNLDIPIKCAPLT